MSRNVRETPPPLSPEATLAIELAAGLKAVIDDVDRRKEQQPTDSNSSTVLSETTPSNDASEKHE